MSTFARTMAMAMLMLAAGSMAQDRMPMRDAKQLMLAALASPDGKAYGILVGDLADAITERFESKSPIYIDVTTETRYQQPGCSRLNVRFWQEGVQLPDYVDRDKQRPPRQTVDFGINYCRDGQPPRSLS